MEDYRLTDPALQRLGLIVRAADVKGQESAAEAVFGLRALAHGFSTMALSVEQRLQHEFPVFDALYEYCRTSSR